MNRKNSDAAMRGSKFKLLLFTAAAAAFLLRLFTALELGNINGGVNSVFTPSSATDLCTYMKLADQIFTGKYQGVFYYQPFYYAVFLPAVRWIAGAGVWQVIIFQSLLGGVTALLSGLAGARLFGRRAGVFSAWMTAVSIPLLLYAPFHQNETLQTFNITLIFYLLVLAVYRHKAFFWFAGGLAFGIGILTRGNLWLLVPAVALVLFTAEKQWKTRLRNTFLFLLPMLLVQLPFILHNSRQLGRFSGPSTAADAVLALGNTWEAPAGGRNTGLPAGPMEYPEAWHRAMAKTTEGISVPRQMLDMLLDQPGAFLELQFRKLLLFWDSGEIPNNVSLYGEGECSLILKYMYPGSSAVLLALGIAGLLFFCRKLFCRYKNGMILLYGFILLYWGAVAAFYILSRFRAPVIPLVTVSGGGFLAVYLDAVKNDRRRLLNLTALLLFSVWASSFAYDFYRNNCESTIMRLVRPEGTILPAQKGYPETRLEHGPFTLGAWNSVELQPSLLLEKRFTSSGKNAVWSIFSPVNGELVCRVPGGEMQIFKLKKGMNEIKVSAISDHSIVEIISAPSGSGAVFDAQRNYSRSRKNLEFIPGEWVTRLNR